MHALAFALLKGDVALADCPCLAQEEKADIAASLTKFDWREDLITNLMEDINEDYISMRFHKIWEQSIATRAPF